MTLETAPRLIFALLICTVSGFTLAQSDRGAELLQEAEQFSGQDKVAIIVAIEDYLEESGFQKLEYAIDDGEALAATLKMQGYLVKSFYNHRAKKHFILDAIDNAGKLLNPDRGTLVRVSLRPISLGYTSEHKTRFCQNHRI